MRLNIDFNDYTRFVKRLSDDEIDSLGDDYTSSYMFSYYFHKKYNLPIEIHDASYEYDFDDVNNIIGLLNNNGIYSFIFEHDYEFHNFVIIIENDIAQMYSICEGKKNFIKTEYNKNYFINTIINICSSNYDIQTKLSDYCNIFCINSDAKHLSNIFFGCSYKIDYETLKIKNKALCENIVQYVFNPHRLERLSKIYNFDVVDYIEFY